MSGVLMICEMGMSAPVVVVATDEITRTLQNSHHAGLDFYFESLDTNLFPQKAAQAAFEERIRQKYRDCQPDTRNVFVVGGVGPLDPLIESIIATALRPSERRYQITYLTQMPELQGQLKNLPERSIVIFPLLFEDGSGRHFIPETQRQPCTQTPHIQP